MSDTTDSATSSVASVTDVTTTSLSTSISASLTTSFSTVTLTSDTSTISSEITSSSSVVVSSVYVTPSTTYLPATTATSIVAVTSTVTQIPASTGGTEPPQVITITSTAPQASVPATTTSSSETSSSTSSSPSALSAAGSASSTSSGGLGTGAKIAIAVIIPIVVVGAAFLIGLWLWRKRKARKSAQELRKSEMAEYGFNPNHDPTLAPVAAAYVDGGSDTQEDNGGYRGWGATSSNRKASTTLGSNGKPAGLAASDGGSQAGGYQHQPSPNGTGQGSEHYSADPMLADHPEGGDGVAALGALGAGGVAAGGLARHRSGNADIRRGTSNASSAYSNGRAVSEASSDTPAVPGPYYQEEVPYNIYNDVQPQHGPYGDGTYGGLSGGQPVIRDVQARRNTRIERAPTFPQTQGGIAQNF